MSHAWASVLQRIHCLGFAPPGQVSGRSHDVDELTKTGIQRALDCGMLQ